MAKPASGIERQAQALMNWVDKRLPVTEFWDAHLAKYYAPKNFNFWYYMGSLALLVLVIQIGTGIFLTMHYKPSAEEAFGFSQNRVLLIRLCADWRRRCLGRRAARAARCQCRKAQDDTQMKCAHTTVSVAGVPTTGRRQFELRRAHVKCA